MRVSPEIASLVPYVPGKSLSSAQREYGLQHMIKLASNENALGVGPRVLAALQARLQEQFRYPDPACTELRETLAQCWNFSAESIGIGNGSNEIIDLLIRIFCAPGEAILTTEYAFVAYAVCAQASRVQVIKSPATKDLRLDLSKMAEILRQDVSKKIRLIFIPNPNNPTGTYCNSQEVQKFVAEFGQDTERLIIFDEAYNDYVRAPDYESAQKYFSEKGNVVLVRTLSKVYALAGLRIGVLIAPSFVLDYFHRVRNPFNVNDLAQVAAVAALKDSEFVRKSVEMTWQGIDYFYAELKKLSLAAVPSQGNFVLFETYRNANLVNEALLKKGVILRPVGNYGLPQHLRITAGLPQENEAAMKALKEVLPSIPVLKGPI
jgi:histidinol-phosphate aminotransferase